MSERDFATPLWPRLAALLGAILMALGGILALVHPAMLASPHDAMNGAVHVYAGYTASRNLVISALLFAMLLAGARASLGSLMVLVGLTQIADAFIDCFEGRWPIVPGVLVLGVLFLAAAARLSGHPFWKRAAWA
ncbi:MAG TPA: hypothetical protein VGD59_14730 [Acidisarcina sp.]